MKVKEIIGLCKTNTEIVIKRGKDVFFNGNVEEYEFNLEDEVVEDITVYYVNRLPALIIEVL